MYPSSSSTRLYSTASAGVPMKVISQDHNAGTVVYEEPYATGGGLTLATSSGPRTTQDLESTTPTGGRLHTRETREQMTPTVSSPVSLGCQIVREEKLQPIVNTRSYETFRRDPRTIFPSGAVVSRRVAPHMSTVSSINEYSTSNERMSYVPYGMPMYTSPVVTTVPSTILPPMTSTNATQSVYPGSANSYQLPTLPGLVYSSTNTSRPIETIYGPGGVTRALPTMTQTPSVYTSGMSRIPSAIAPSMYTTDPTTYSYGAAYTTGGMNNYTMNYNTIPSSHTTTYSKPISYAPSMGQQYTTNFSSRQVSNPISYQRSSSGYVPVSQSSITGGAASVYPPPLVSRASKI